MKQKSIKELEKIGTGEAFYEIGERYCEADKTIQNYTKAFEYFRKAEDTGSIKGSYGIAKCYYYGRGVEKNYKKAFEIFKDLADTNGDIGAIVYLAAMYYYGKGIEVNYELARKYCEIAEQNSKCDKSIFQFLGEIYFYGKEIEADYLKAKTYYEKALDENYDDTYYKLGLLYLGDYGFKDEEKANEYFNKIEKDLLLAIIYLLLATRPIEEQNLAGICDRLGYSREYFDSLIEVVENIQCYHPAVVYYRKLRCLRNEEYNNIAKQLKAKVERCLKNEPEFINDFIYSVPNEEFVVFYSDIIINSNNSKSIEKYLKELEDNENATLLYIFGYIMVKDKDDIEQGLKKLFKAKEKGNIFAIYSLAEVYYEGAKDKKGTRIQKNYLKSLSFIEEALNTFKENYENKSVFENLKILLGKIYYDGGYGVNKDLDKAVQIFKEVAEKYKNEIVQKLYEKAMLELEKMQNKK